MHRKFKKMIPSEKHAKNKYIQFLNYFENKQACSNKNKIIFSDVFITF